DVIESSHAAFKYLNVCLLNTFLAIVSCRFNSSLSLDQLVLDCLPVDRAQVMFATAIHVKQIDEIFPALIEALNVVRNLLSAGELFVIRVDLILHPAQVFDCFTLARIEQLDLRFTLLLAEF